MPDANRHASAQPEVSRNESREEQGGYRGQPGTENHIRHRRCGSYADFAARYETHDPPLPTPSPAAPRTALITERWYCWIAPVGMEFAVWSELDAQGFAAVLPLKLERDRRPHAIVPAFPRYGLIALAPASGLNRFERLPEQRAWAPSWTFLRRYVQTEAWGRVAEPRPFRAGAVEELFGRGRQGDGVIDDTALIEALRLYPGDPIRVVEGWLAGQGGTVSRSRRHGDEVEALIGGRRVTMPRSAVAKAENPGAGAGLGGSGYPSA